MKNPQRDSGQTKSEPMDQVLELAERVAQQQAPVSELMALLDERLRLCLEYQESFEERGRARGERFLEEHGSVLEQVLLHLQYCEKGFRRLLEFCRSGGLDDLEAARKILVEVAGPLKGVMEYYGQLYMTFGPSAYPLMNTVHLTLKEILEGKRSPELLDAVTANAIVYHDFGIKEIEESAEAFGEGFEAKKKAYQEVILALQELRPVKDLQEIESATRPLRLALEATTSADERILHEHLAEKPTNMPSANIVINVFKGGLAGIYDLHQLDETLEWYRHVAEELEEQFEVAVHGETSSTVIRDELPRFRELLDRHYEILEDLQQDLKEFGREGVEVLLEEFTEVVGELSDSAQVFVDAAEREGKVMCVKCGHSNPPENRNCGECGFRLPKVAGMSTMITVDLKERIDVPGEKEEEPPYELGANTYRLLEAAGLFHEGSIEDSYFRALIDESRRMVERSDDAVEDYSFENPPSDTAAVVTPEQLEGLGESKELFREAKHLLQDGIDEWLEALDMFEQYIDSRHYPLVEKGCELLFHASQKMHEVARLGKTAEKTLGTWQQDEEEFDEESATFGDQIEEEPDSIQQPLDITDYSTLGGDSL